MKALYAVFVYASVYNLILFANCRVSNISPRIVGGEVADNGQFPFAAAINVLTETATFFCGGALINEEWILTSATCTYQTVAANVSLGSVSLEEDDPNRVTLSAFNFIAHEEFDAISLENDIGLVKLSEAVKFSETIQPIRLATINLPSILNPIVIGWGETSDDDDDLSPELNYATVSVVKNDHCKYIYGPQIKDTMVCVLGNNNEGACYGDTGSPLVVRPIGSSFLQLFGVSSFFGADGCGRRNPSGYTRVFYYLDWIREVTDNAV